MLSFKGSIKNYLYIMHFYFIFNNYCKRFPKIKPEYVKNKIYYSITFDTKTLELFNIYHEYFYIKINNKNRKIVPVNIEILLTPRGLAY